MQRSWPEFRQAVELVRNGYIGDVQTVKVNVGLPPVPYNLPAETMPDTLHWDFWLGPNTPQNYNHFLAPGLTDDFWAKWRDYREFGGGGMTDWGAHMFDIAQWGLDMDDTGPTSVTPPDKDHPFLTYQYANGITMTHEPGGNQGLTFVGSKGSVHVMRRSLETTPPGLKDQVIGADEKHVYFSDNHYKDFLQAMRNRTKPVADVEIGHRTATVCNIGNIAYQLNRPLQWNPHKEEFVNDDEANKLTGREMRKEWVV
jgi:predicted dehydrogenase